MQPSPKIPPGWYPDPNGMPSQRYWDGVQWTGQVAPFAPPGPAGWSPSAQAGTDKPSVAPTILVTLFFGLFGLIPAIRHSRLARARGFTVGRYWTAFWVSLVGPTAAVIVTFVILLAASSPSTRNNLSHTSVEQYIENSPNFGHPTGVECNDGVDIPVFAGSSFSCVANDGSRFNGTIVNQHDAEYEITPSN